MEKAGFLCHETAISDACSLCSNHRLLINYEHNLIFHFINFNNLLVLEIEMLSHINYRM